jgi:hypothetical protein
MASLYKKPVVVRDPKTGEKSKAKSKKWWGRYIDASGLERRVPLASDKIAAQAMLNELVRKVEREKAGLIDPADAQLKKPLTTHIDEYESYLKAKGNTHSHYFKTAQRLRAVAKACDFKRINDISASVSGRVPGGNERKTCKMMRHDLGVARKKWIDDGQTDTEKKRREKTDCLKYCDSAGAFADFHSNRHTFITGLERAGVRPKVAQTLARHSDIRLTLGVYTHSELCDQTAAISSLPAPPEHNGNGRQSERASVDDPPAENDRPGDFSCTTEDVVAQEKVPTMVPRGAEYGAVRVTGASGASSFRAGRRGRLGAQRRTGRRDNRARVALRVLEEPRPWASHATLRRRRTGDASCGGTAPAP